MSDVEAPTGLTPAEIAAIPVTEYTVQEGVTHTEIIVPGATRDAPSAMFVDPALAAEFAHAMNVFTPAVEALKTARAALASSRAAAAKEALKDVDVALDFATGGVAPHTEEAKP